MNLQAILRAYRPAYAARYSSVTTPEQWSALNAMLGCRTPQYGALSVHCDLCDWHGLRYRSCGHRSCSLCHHHDNVLWSDRQCQKLLPVPYFMVTFTLPSELRSLARRHSKVVFQAMFAAAIATLRQFGLNDAKLQGELAATAVLHTHTRRIDYHPHLHLIVPAGVVHSQRREWRKLKGSYLFNHFNLARVFRAIVLKQLRQANLDIPVNPLNWVAHCKPIGKGKQAIQYLSRYLNRGLLGDRQIIRDDGSEVTFSYRDSRSQALKTRALKGEDLIRLLLIHVLPKGFRRTRDYGFLHGNAKNKLRILQYLLKVVFDKTLARLKARLICPCCKSSAHIAAFFSARELAQRQSG